MNADDADAVRRLYALPPGEFVEARNDAADRAGSRDEAARIRKLRRPTVAAWAVNLLVADSPADIDALAGLGERLRTAQAEMRGSDLRELSAERNRTVSALVRRTAELARDAGHPLAGAAQREVETTLDAVVADPDSAEAVRAGTLTKALAYSGTGFTGASSQVAVARRAESRTTSQPEAGSGRGQRAGARSGTGGGRRTKAKAEASAEPGTGARTRAGAQARTESEARREARRRAVAKAEQELETAKRRRTEARDALDAAREHRESAAAERHRLRTELAKAERAVTRADDRVTKAADSVDTAESALDRARHRLTEARAGRLS